MLITSPVVFVTAAIQSLLWLDKKKEAEKCATRSAVQPVVVEENGHGSLKESGFSEVKEIKEELK